MMKNRKLTAFMGASLGFLGALEAKSFRERAKTQPICGRVTFFANLLKDEARGKPFMPLSLRSEGPIVTLEAVIQDPYDLAVATARTCYSAKGVIRVPDVRKDEASRALRDKIADTTREAGHLTTRQQAHFLVSIDK